MTAFRRMILAEMHRFTARRLIRGLAVAILGLLVLQVGVAFFQSSKDPESGLDDARREISVCLRERDRAIDAGHATPDTFTCPTLEEMRPFYDKRFRYADTMREAFQGLGILCLILGLVVGGSFVGGEWGTGSMTTTLTWEPRRGYVLLAKWAAAVVGVALAVLAFLLLVAIVFYPVGVMRGTTEGTTASFVWTQSGIALRDAFLGVFGATVGISLATLVRSTAGAVGAGFFYGAVVDGLLSVWRKGAIREWTLQYNVARLLGIPVPVEGSGTVEPDGFGPPTEAVLSATRPALILAIYGALFLASAYAVFRRRDVT